jgi:threonine dehydrogenase-like Zn-dependent dehydrogenase
MTKMKAAVFVEPGRIVLDDKPVPDIGPLDALIKVTTTTICDTDSHILKGEYPVERGLTIGHEPVGVIEKLGSAVQGYREGQCVIAGAITPSGYSNACLCGCLSQDGPGAKHGFKAIGGWKFGNTIDGCQAEYVRVPDAMANLAPIPDGLTDEQVLMCPDIMSTGFSGAESGGIRIGDTVAVFAQGPIGLCATSGARLGGASIIIAVDAVPTRLEASRALGADHCVDFTKVDPVEEIMRLTDGRGVDVAIGRWGRRPRSRPRCASCGPAERCRASGYTRRICGFPRPLRRRPGGSQDHHHLVSRRQGAHAAADVGSRDRTRRPARAGHASVSAG